MTGRLRLFGRDEGAATAAEFALVLPLALAFLLGMIDVGRFMWTLNKAEKATQMGARFAIVTAPVPSGLAGYDYTASITAGLPVPASAYGTMTCGTTTALGAETCVCAAGGQPCPWGSAVAAGKFNLIYDRMQAMLPELQRQHVKIDYAPSGLGYAGDPIGPDIYPVVTVRLQDFKFKPITTLLFNISTPTPTVSYSLTMEDGVGVASN